MGLILGHAVFPAVFTALLLQALLFGFGGLLVLGVNTFVMGFASLATYLVFGRMIRKGSWVITMSFMAGAFAVMIAAVIAGMLLMMTDSNFAGAVKLLLIAHAPVAVAEGCVTSFLVMWLKRAAPEFLS